MLENIVVDNPKQVEEEEGQGYINSSDLDEVIERSSEIILDDLPINSLMVEDTKSLSIEQAQKLIPKEALKVLKEKFNGSLENCRPIKDYDRMV